MKKGLTGLCILILLTLCLAGCQKQAAPAAEPIATAAPAAAGDLVDYLASVKEKSAAIRASLEQEELTQTAMNVKSEELRALWDKALTKVLEEAARVLPEAEMAALTAEQNTWAETMKAAVEAAGKEYEGGSMYALVVNTEAARLTEERAYELYELLK